MQVAEEKRKSEDNFLVDLLYLEAQLHAYSYHKPNAIPERQYQEGIKESVEDIEERKLLEEAAFLLAMKNSRKPK